MDINATISAVITGGASGLGEATARALAKNGARVAIFDMNADKGEKVAREIGGIYCNVNVTSEESVADGFKRARDAIGLGGLSHALRRLDLGADAAIGDLFPPLHLLAKGIGDGAGGAF